MNLFVCVGLLVKAGWVISRHEVRFLVVLFGA